MTTDDKLLKLAKIYAEIDAMLIQMTHEDVPVAIKQEFRRRVKRRLLRMINL